MAIEQQLDEFEGEAHGTGVSFILVDLPPGGGVRLHQHPYAEIFIVQEGHASFTLGTSTIDVVAPRTLVARLGDNRNEAWLLAGTGRIRVAAPMEIVEEG